MKKLFLFLFFVSVKLSAFSQDHRFGVKGGVNFADINGNDLDKNSHRSKLGWHLGVMVNFHPVGTKFFSIQPELIYSRKGYENYSSPFEFTDQSNGNKATAQEGGLVGLNYLDLPVMFNFKTGIIIYEVGPQFSYLVGADDNSTTRYKFNDSEVVLANNRFDKDGVRKFDAGIAVGLRFESTNGIALGFRFNQGFIKLPQQITDVPLPPPGFNQNFQLFASYLIPEQ